MLMNTTEYLSIIENIKSEIRAAQYRAAVHANADMLLLYHDIGCVINEHKSWGNKFIDNLATDIRIAFPESKGYSVRNLKYMAKFAEIYPNREFVQQVVAQIPWGHNIVLLDKVADMDERNGISKSQRKTAGLEMFLSIRLKATCIRDRCWQIKLQILITAYRLRKVNLQRRQ